MKPSAHDAARDPDAADADAGDETVARWSPDAAQTEALKPAIVEAISTVFDPEIPVNIWELGLIYDVFVDAAGVAGDPMTLTAPGCPAAQSLPVEVADEGQGGAGRDRRQGRRRLGAAWTKDRMSDVPRSCSWGLW